MTVDEYLADLPEDRRNALEVVRKTILKNLPEGYEEGVQYGVIGYYIPHRIYPAGYHCDPKQPVPYASLASRKNYMTISLMSIYAHPDEESWFREEWSKSGKRLDMGKACIRFKKLEDLPLEVIGQAIARTPVNKLLGFYESVLKRSKSKS